MKLVFVRHFPTKGNGLKQYIGRTDEPIDEAATVEILKAVGAAEDYYPKVDKIVTSQMLRCKQTAEIIYPTIPMIAHAKLNETDFGDFEGKTYEELKELPDYQQWLMSGAAGKVPNGESRAEFLARCVEGFCEVMERLLEESVESAAFVIHGGTIMSLLSQFAAEEKEFYDWQVKNGRGYMLDFNAKLWKEGRRCLFHIKKL